MDDKSDKTGVKSAWGGEHCLRGCRGRGLCQDARCLRGLTKALKRQELTGQHES